MSLYPARALERAMKIQEVILRAASGKILWMQAAEILGISPRGMQRWKRRYEEHGYDGLFDRRRPRPSPKRVPMATVQSQHLLHRGHGASFGTGPLPPPVKQAVIAVLLVAPLPTLHAPRRNP